MKMRLLVSHPANSRPKVKMARVDGCTFFRRESGWRHADGSCERNDHWIWSALITIGQCTLIRKDETWRHKSGPQLENGVVVIKDDDCDAAKAYQEAKNAALVEKPPNRPACVLDLDVAPTMMGDCKCKFVLDGDIFRHLGKRCNKRAHHLDLGDRSARLTRTPGGSIDEFVKTTNEALAKIVIPPNPRSHITVEV